MPIKTLFLHIGHGKTGSSWLQSSLRLSRGRLAAAGITYPSDPDEAAGTDPVRLSSGNGFGMLVSAEDLVVRLTATATNDVGSLLFSSELLFEELDGHRLDHAFIAATAARYGFARVSALLFIRDPIGHAASCWQQDVKAGGSTSTIDEFFAAYDIPDRVAEVLHRLETEGIDVVVRNYSRCHRQLIAETAAWLGVPDDTLCVPPVPAINRSLTRAELALQQALNRRLGRCAHLLADPLVARLPDIPSDDVRPPEGLQAATWDRLAPAIERVNARIPAEHRYQRDVRAGVPAPDTLPLSPAQIEAIADAVADEIGRLRGLIDRPELAVRSHQLAAALCRRVGMGLRHRLLR